MAFLDNLDQAVTVWFQAQRSAGLDVVVNNLTDLGHRFLVALVALVVIAVFLVRRQFRPAVVLLLVTLASYALVEGTKLVVRRPRPEHIQRVQPPSLFTQLIEGRESQPQEVSHQAGEKKPTYSFPSGHALSSGAVYGAVALLLARRLRKRWPRALLIGGVLALVLLIGLTRLYLGAHYLTDVIAGWAAGLGCALLGGWLDERWAGESEAANGGGGHPLPITRFSHHV